MVKAVHRFEVWLIRLDPPRGSEIAKARPCVVVSPDVVNQKLNTILIAPITSTRKGYPTRVNCEVNEQPGQIALDQVRALDKARLVRKVDQLDEATSKKVCKVLVELFQN